MGAEVLAVKHPHKKKLGVALEVYEATPDLIPVDVTKEVVESVAQKKSGTAGPDGIDTEALQGWLLKLGYHSRKKSY